MATIFCKNRVCFQFEIKENYIQQSRPKVRTNMLSEFPLSEMTLLQNQYFKGHPREERGFKFLID